MDMGLLPDQFLYEAGREGPGIDRTF